MVYLFLLWLALYRRKQKVVLFAFFSTILWQLFITCRLTKTTPYNANLCFAPQYRPTQTINDMILFPSF